jgi:glycosyltransferase involved in cell wall biosynthesis
MRILFLNRSFWPDTEATGLLLDELAQDLAFEHEVTVICGPANTSRARVWPLVRREQRGAVKVLRTSGPHVSKRNLMLRVATLSVYGLLAAVTALREPTDVIIAETDPPVLGRLGAALKRRTGCRLIYYCQDLYPDIGEATGGLKFRPLRDWLARGNDHAYRDADATVVLASDMAGRLQRKGVPVDRITIIPNWIDCRKVQPRARSRASEAIAAGQFVVMYAGNLGWSQNLEAVVETACLMRDDPRVKFVLIGDGARKRSLEQEAHRKGRLNIEFVERRPPGAMSEVLAAGDLHLIPLAAGAAGSVVPSKVYWTLAAGKPFVAMMESEAEVARLARTHNVGFVVPPGDAAALARTIAEGMRHPKLLADMGRRARMLAEAEYDRPLITRRFAALLETLGSGSILARHGELTPANNLESAPAMPVE